jgi:cytochrome c biogenesis protein CcmG, thiol:disulfide interchange protein DsbE
VNWKHAGIAGIGVVPVIAMLSYGLTHDPKAIPSPLPGKPAPAFALTTLEKGDSVHFAPMSGQVTVVNFWASWCIPCRDEHEDLIEASRAYTPRGVHFYGVLYNDTPDNARKYLEEMGVWGYPTLLDPHTYTAINYGIYGVPETFFIGKDGRVAYKQVGPVTVQMMNRVLEPMLRGQSVSLK